MQGTENTAALLGRVAMSLIRRLEQIASGVAGDRLGFGVYRVRERLLPDLVSDFIGRRSLQVNLEDHRPAPSRFSLRVPVSGETAMGTSSSS